MNKSLSLYNKWTLFLFFLLSACSPAQQSNISITESFSPNPTRAAQPSFTETPTQTAFVISEKYELPSWLASSNFQVFSIVTNVSDTSNELTFINANTHEKFVINVPTSNISRYFWTPDGKSFGFIQSDFLNVLSIDLISGKVTKYAIPEDSAHCLFDYQKTQKPALKYIEVYSSLPSEPSFLCLESVFRLQQIEKNGKAVTVFENLETSQKTELSNSGESLLNIDYSVSPNQTQLAILQGEGIDPYGLDLSGTRIRIYDLESGNVITSFEGYFCLLKWSPDGSKLLTTMTNSSGCYSNATPAIIYLEKNLLQPITANENAQHSKVHISTYNWSQDSNYLYYLYVNPDRSDVCYYNLKNEEIFCPTGNFSELSGLNVEHYKLSPDERFLAFSYGSSCAGCDFWGEPSSVVIQIDGSDYFSLGKEIWIEDVSSTYPFNTLMWRPLPKQ